MMAVEIECIQGSAAWVKARLGVVTASALSRVVTPGKYALSKQREGYLCELLAEWALGVREESFLGTHWTERGLAYEQEALDAIALVLETEPPRPMGFVYRDESRAIGCSPDALIGEDGGLELKCPMAKTHLEYLFSGGVPSDYWMQVQGSLWITGRQWWVFESYHPALPPHIARVQPDPHLHAALDEHVPAFVAELEARKQALIERGFRPMEVTA